MPINRKNVLNWYNAIPENNPSAFWEHFDPDKLKTNEIECGDAVLAKIPDLPGKISYRKRNDREYVFFLKGRKYNAEKQYSEPDRVLIGRRVEGMPGLMYPNDNYERIFSREGTEMDENMTPEEEQFVQHFGVYGLYNSFFNGLYNEFKQQTRKHADDRVNRYKAESINKVLKPLKDMMQGEEYGRFLRLMEPGEGERGMSYGDGMILLTQYKSALGKYHREHR